MTDPAKRSEDDTSIGRKRRHLQRYQHDLYAMRNRHTPCRMVRTIRQGVCPGLVRQSNVTIL